MGKKYYFFFFRRLHYNTDLEVTLEKKYLTQPYLSILLHSLFLLKSGKLVREGSFSDGPYRRDGS